MSDTSNLANLQPSTPEAPAATPAPEQQQNAQQTQQQTLNKLETAAKDPNLSKSQKQEIQQKLKEYKLKVNGKDEVIKFDPFNDSEVVKHLQKSRASDQKFQEASDLRKAAVEFITQLRSNPKKVLSDPNIGIDVKKFAQEILNEEVEEAAKSPEQREKEKLQRELEEIKERYKLEEEDRKSKEFERLQAEQEQKLESGISTALETHKLPKTPYTVKKMAEMMMIALQNNIDLSPEDVAPLVRKQMQAEIKEMLSASSDDVLEEFLKDQLPRIRKRNLAKVKNQIQTASNVKATANAKIEDKKPEKKQTIRDFLKV